MTTEMDVGEAKRRLDDAARQYRWRQGFVCPQCGANHGWPDRRGWWKCSNCRLVVSSKSKTVLHGSHVAIGVWILAVHLMASEPTRLNKVTGVSAWKLKTSLGIGSYETAWRMLGRLTSVMRDAVEEDLLARHVEVGAIRLDRAKGNRLHIPPRDGSVLMAVEDRPSYGIHRIRMMHVDRQSVANVRKFVRAVVEPGTPLSSDGSLSDSNLSVAGYPKAESLWVPGQKAALAQLRVQYLQDLPDDYALGGALDPPPVPEWHDCATQRVCRTFVGWWNRRHRRVASTVDLPSGLAEFCLYFNRRRWRYDRRFAELLNRMFVSRAAGRISHK